MHELRINPSYLEAIRYGEKTSTIRLGYRDIPLWEKILFVDEYGAFTVVDVNMLMYTTVGHLTDTDATRDGFNSRQELVDALEEIYGSLDFDTGVTVIGFTIDDEAE